MICGVLDHAFALVAHASGERAGQHRDGEEDQEREQFLRLGDGEGVERRDEKEVVGDEGSERGDDRRPRAEAHAAEQHRGQEDHRQVRQPAAPRSAPRRPRRRRRPTRARRRSRRRAPSDRVSANCGTRRYRLRLLVRDDMDFDRPGAAHERVRQRSAEQARQSPGARLAEHDLGHVLAPREAQDFRRDSRCPGAASCRRRAARRDRRSWRSGSPSWRRPPGRPARCRPPSRRR